MEIFTVIWNHYLYIPLFNLLIWLYTNYASYNLGVAIIILTIMLRIALLPFTILDEIGKITGKDIDSEIAELEQDFSKDPVKKKIAIRQLLKKNRIRPWAKAMVLGIQALTLVLLYKVFIGGINTEEKLHLLYSVRSRPDFINTKFLWFDIAQRNLIIPALTVGIYIFIQTLFKQFKQKNKLTKKEQAYALFFPAAIFLILYILPAAKSLFVLTSLVFSSIISMITILIKISLNKPKKT